MATLSHLANHFLIAMPTLADPNFFQTVTYLCDHNDEGAMGLVINRPLEMTLGDLLEHIDVEVAVPAAGRQAVYYGGPVQSERGFVLHQPIGDWQATLGVTEDTGLTMSRDILEAIARGEGPQRYLIMLGYAGWASGQLEQEIAANAWLSGPADALIMFDQPAEQRWRSSAALLGVDLDTLSTDVGHA